MPVFRPLSMGIVLGFLPLTILGQRQLVHVALPAKQTVERRLVAPSGDFVELCASVRAGRVITWRFEATAPLAFHTHFHVDGDVRAPESMSAVTAAQGRLALKAPNDYCWLWANRSAEAVTIRMLLRPE